MEIMFRKAEAGDNIINYSHDEQFKFDQTSSRAYAITYSSNGVGTIDRRFSDAVEAGKNGYAYVYFANESNELVYFDNFMLS